MNRAEEERQEEQLRITSWDLDLSAGQCGSASGTTDRFPRLGSELLSADCYLMNLNDDVCRFNISGCVPKVVGRAAKERAQNRPQIRGFYSENTLIKPQLIDLNSSQSS